MMKRLFLVIFSFIAFNLSAENVLEGQSNDEVKAISASESFEPHWFASIAAGPQIYFGDHNKQVAFGKRISPALDVAVGRWFTPIFGARLMYSGVSLKGATQNGSHSTGEEVPGKGGHGYWLQKQKINYFNFHVEALFNVTNWLLGVDENRVYDCSPYAGLGLMAVTKDPSSTSVAGHFGILNSFHISPVVDLDIDLRGTMFGDGFDKEEGERGGEGILTLNFGVTYKF